MSGAHGESDPFRAVHRHRRRRATAWGSAVAVALSALLGFAWIVPSYAAAPYVVGAAGSAFPAAAPVEAPSSAGDAPTEAEMPPTDAAAAPTGGGGAQHPVDLPIPTAPDTVAPVAVAPASPSAGPQTVVIEIDTSGYQDELDRCLWVRMDIGATAPIVGAHNTCGGDVVLGMAVGDVVRLSGVDLDGDYAVAGTREARKGQNAFEATDGMDAAVVLQTCHWEGDGVRLVALVPIATGG